VQIAIERVLVPAKSGKHNPDDPKSLAQAVEALAPMLNRDQVNTARGALLAAMGSRDNTPAMLASLAEAVHVLPGGLSHEEQQMALNPVVSAMASAKEIGDLKYLASAVLALGSELNPERAQIARTAVLTAMIRTQKLTLERGGSKQDDVLRAHAAAIAALPPPLNEGEVSALRGLARREFAWAVSPGVANAWADLMIHLLPPSGDEDAPELVAALKYPLAQGPATETLLSALQVRLPSLKARLEDFNSLPSNTKWFKPDGRVICPEPPDEMSGLSCPEQAAAPGRAR
jgi:hypothetical protein